MPLHDWTRVTDNVFHYLHMMWIAELLRRLNGGALPAGYLARPEEYVGPYQSDVLTLEVGAPPSPVAGGAQLEPTVTIAPPRFSAVRQRRVTVFSARDERRVAVVEIVSPGNKDSDARARWFEAKLVDYLAAGLHVAALDLLPPTGPAPGLAAAVARELGSEAVPEEGRCVTSFERSAAPDAVRIYHQRLALGQALPDAPLFLEPGKHVLLPLEATYQAAVQTLPRHDLDRLGAG